jgi:hypothetical protein
VRRLSGLCRAASGLTVMLITQSQTQIGLSALPPWRWGRFFWTGRKERL